MNKCLAAILIFMAGLSSVSAKDKKGVIMWVDGQEVPSEEFIYLFQKNNNQQAEPLSLDEYLDLFKVYRLKVAEAKKEGVDTTSAFKKEMQQYRRELLEPYVADTIFLNMLVDIAEKRDREVVESSHIMIIRTNDEERNKRNLALLDSIRTLLLNGEDFIALARKYSQDKFSSDKGGYLGFNSAGTFPYGFETAVYETPEGEISEIVESHVGWHLVKSGARRPVDETKRNLRTRKQIKEDVLRKSSSPFDTRYHDIRNNRISRLKTRHIELASVLDNLSPEKEYEMLMDAEEQYQYQNNPEYRNLVDEYTNGSLLYEVSVNNVWDKAGNDDEALKDYYRANSDKYKWEKPHAKGILVMASNDSVASYIKDAIKELAPEEVVGFIKKNYKKNVEAERFNVTKDSNSMIDNLVFGENADYQKNPAYQVYFVVDGRVVEQPESLEDVRSQVLSDYQEVLETNWVESLKASHKVEINDKELSRIRKSLRQ